MVCEAQLANVASNDCTVFMDANELITVNEQSSATFERDELIDCLEGISAENLFVIGDELTEIEKSQLDLKLDIYERKDRAVYLLEQYLQLKPINLLQGKYTVERKRQSNGGELAGLAKAAIFLVAVYLAGLGVQGNWNAFKADQLGQQNRDSYTEMFPRDSVPITAAQLRRRFESKLRVKPNEQKTQFVQFTQLLNLTAPSVVAKGNLQSLTFNQEKAEMTIEILLRNYEQVEQIQVDLEKRGISSEMVSASSVDGGINARFKASF